MAEQTLSELVINLISWIESLHEKNLKYEAQLESLSRDLAQAQNSNQQLEARLSAYHQPDVPNVSVPVPNYYTNEYYPVNHDPMHQPPQQYETYCIFEAGAHNSLTGP